MIDWYRHNAAGTLVSTIVKLGRAALSSIRPVLDRALPGGQLVAKMVTCLGLLLFASTTTAATLDFVLEQQGSRIDQAILVANDEALIKGAGGDPTIDLLFQSSPRRLLVIDHRGKSYMRIDEKVIAEVAVLADTVSQAVASQKGVLSDLFSTFGFDDGAESSSANSQALTDSGRTLQIGGFDCRLYQALEKKRLMAEVCFAAADKLKMPPVARETIKNYADFANRLVTQAGKLLELLGLQLPRVGMANLPGVPIGMHAPDQQLKAKLVRIDPEARHEKTLLPRGYSQQPIPFTSG